MPKSRSGGNVKAICLKNEIRNSLDQNQTQAKFNRPTVLFRRLTNSPHGKYNLPVKQLTKKYFRTACSTRLGKVQAGDDLFSLKRVDTYYLSTDHVFNSILSVNFNLYLNFRQILRDLKQVLSYGK